MPSEVLELTPAGRHELTARERGLSLPQRWLLVRVNGRDSLADLAQASNQADARQRLPLDAERLVQKGLVRWLVPPQDDVMATVPAVLDRTHAVSGGLGVVPPRALAAVPHPLSAGAAPAAEPARRSRQATPWLAVAAVMAVVLAGLAAWGLRSGVQAQGPATPAQSSGVAAGPAAAPLAGPAGPALLQPAAPTRDDAAGAAAVAAPTGARPVPVPPGPVVVAVPAAAPAAALPAAATVLPPIASAAPVPLPSVSLPARGADPSAALPAPTLAEPAALSLPAPAVPAAAAPSALVAAPAAGPGRLQPLFSPPPRLPRDWQEDTRLVVSFNANLTVDASGAVTQVAFSGITPADAALVRAARQSLSQWRFPPGAPGRAHAVELVFRVE
jgi:hypothetical protein